MLLDIAVSIVGGESDGEVLEEEDINILDNTDQAEPEPEGRLDHHHGRNKVIYSHYFSGH